MEQLSHPNVDDDDCHDGPHLEDFQATPKVHDHDPDDYGGGGDDDEGDDDDYFQRFCQLGGQPQQLLVQSAQNLQYHPSQNPFRSMKQPLPFPDPYSTHSDSHQSLDLSKSSEVDSKPYLRNSC
ncbi:hypothetical protein PPACK8108_LOCUS16774 [Phakopsora pachyrhizi]|uniref:Uncharacterized protein n=1 Tax=Phakopsora pachyrhizi TaxID=170000 RepID=A0AAV0B834_PHAPC|nr:hypothetical protein PPACK8108_LOCUS16774 [Phakopsora pachyrhizi]